MIGDHPGVLEFGVGFFVPEEGDEIVISGREEVHGKLRFVVVSVEPCDLVVVLVLIENGAGCSLVLERRGDVESFGEEGFVEEVAALVDVEVAETDEILVVGVDVGCPFTEPAGDALQFGDAVF